MHSQSQLVAAICVTHSQGSCLQCLHLSFLLTVPSILAYKMEDFHGGFLDKYEYV